MRRTITTPMFHCLNLASNDKSFVNLELFSQIRLSLKTSSVA